MSSGDGSAVDKLVEALKQPSPLANNNAQGTGAFAEVRALIAKGDGLIESLSQRLWKQGAVMMMRLRGAPHEEAIRDPLCR